MGFCESERKRGETLEDYQKRLQKEYELDQIKKSTEFTEWQIKNEGKNR